MGDSIEQALEETIPILRAAQRAKLLSAAEITDIVRNRRNHEYALSSPSVTRDDFLRYAAFERELAQVIKKRAEKRNKKRPKTQLVIGKSAARVNLVYSRAVKKFRGDDELWLHYAKHCLRTGAERAAGKLFAKAIAFRPDSESVWLAAVAFHFDTCADAKGGRALAQRALRALPESTLIWKEYFRLEVFYLAKLISRRVALGLAITPQESDRAPSEVDGQTKNVEGKNDREEQHEETGSNRNSTKPAQTDVNPSNMDNPQSAGDSDRSLPEKNHSIAKNASIDEKSAATSKKKLAFWQGGVPMAVFRNACENVSFSVDSCADIWNILASTPFVPIQLMESMAAALSETNTTSIATYLLNARLTWDIAHAQFVIEKASSPEQEQRCSMEADERSTHLESRKSSLAKSAEGALAALRSVLMAHLSGERSSKAKCAATICLDGFKDLVQSVDESGHITEEVAALRAQVNEDKIIAAPANKGQDISGSINSSLKPSEYGVNDLVEALIDNQGELTDALFETLQTKVLVPFRDLTQERILCEWLSREEDLRRLRQVCDLFLPLPPRTMGSLRVAIEAEIRLCKHGEDQPDVRKADMNEFITRTRRMFKMGCELSAAKRDQDMWLDYVEFERKLAKNSKQANIVMRKASKVLDKESFELLTERLTLRNLQR